MSDYISYNANPDKNRVGDCTIRAISAITGKSWEEVYIGIAVIGYIMHDMPSSNAVWGEYLKRHGFTRYAIPNNTLDSLTVEDFCQIIPRGDFLLAIPGHLVYVSDGKYYDTWDSGNEIPLYYWCED